MPQKSEYELSDKRTIQNVKRYSLVCGFLALTSLALIHFSDFLINHPIWTLRILSLVYLFWQYGAFHRGLFRDAQHSQWEWDRFTKLKRKVNLILRAALIITLSLSICQVAFIMFGAPFFHEVAETFHFSMFFTAMATFPGCLLFGTEEHRWLRIILGMGPKTVWEKSWYKSFAGLVIGAWMGAIVIPLDWDRPWQPWPISSTYGALFSYGVVQISTCISLVSVRHRRGKSNV